MKEFKGTKGEWELFGHSIYTKDKNVIVACLDASLSNMRSTELGANGKLLAASKDLLEALINVEYQIAFNIDILSAKKGKEVEVSGMISQLQKAISKALG